MPVAIAIASVKPSAVASVWTLAEQRDADRIQSRERARAGDRQQQAEDRAAAGQHDALGQHLRDQPPAAGTRARVRIAISFCRAAVRASSRFDRLAQTISITTPTAPASTQTASRIRPLT